MGAVWTARVLILVDVGLGLGRREPVGAVWTARVLILVLVDVGLGLKGDGESVTIEARS